MEVAIRWSNSSSYHDPCFLIADVNGHSFKHCRVTGRIGTTLQYEQISRSKGPSFRAFDWHCKNNLVATGQWSGDVNITGLENGSPSILLPVKSQRACNAVTFNTGSLLATGLEKVRNDFCLNVYDLNQWSRSTGTQDGPATRPVIEPVRKLASSEGIMSIKFFPDDPNLLVAGIKQTCLRLYDLRQNTGNPALQYQTQQVHNIAVDPCDPNYFASATTGKDTTVTIWDRRSALRPSPLQADSSRLDGPLLELRDVFERGKDPDGPSIWSLRYSFAERGCLGVLGGGGNFRIFHTQKEFVPDNATATKRYTHADSRAEDLSINSAEVVAPPVIHPTDTAPQDASEQIRAFDFMNVGSHDNKYQAIVFRDAQNIGVHKLRGKPPALAVSVKNRLIIGASSVAGSHVEPQASTQIQGVHSFEPPRISSISEDLEQLSRRFEAARASHKSLDLKNDEIIDDGWNDDMEISPARGSPMKQALVSQIPRSKGTIEDALLLADKLRRRTLEGYLFDAQKNLQIIKEDPPLVNMWQWLSVAIDSASNDRMISNSTDFSFLGIFNIWNGRLGNDPSARIRPGASPPNTSAAVENLVEALDLPEVSLAEKTTKPYHRRLALHTLGFSPSPLDHVKSLALSGHNTEAALHALLVDDFPLAVQALRSGKRGNQHRALASLIYSFAQCDPAAKIHSQISAILPDETDPFARACLACISSSYWPEILSHPSLPPRYTAALALKWHPDSELSSHLAAQTNAATREGDVARLLYTGLSEDAHALFAAYISRTSDLQSAVLALSFAVPRFWTHERIAYWRDSFRKRLNARQLWLQRTRFDAASARLSQQWGAQRALLAARRQVTLSCSSCDGPLDREHARRTAASEGAGESVAPQLPPPPQKPRVAEGQRSSTSKVLGSDGTMCPRCGARLPRCAICDGWLGVLDSESAGGIAKERRDALQEKDPFGEHMDVCLTCRHVCHRRCANGWFVGKEKKECPVVGCSCRCDELDGMKK
jgi:hypothetical protein